MNKSLKTILIIICAASIAGSALAKSPTIADLLSQIIALQQQLLQLLIQQQQTAKPTPKLLYGAPDTLPIAAPTTTDSSFFKFNSASIDKTSGKGKFSDQADIKISFKTGLQGQDMHINNVDASNPGIILKSSGDLLGAISCSSPDGAYYDYSNKEFIIYSGQAKTINCYGHIIPQLSGQYYVYISDLKWSYSQKTVPDYTISASMFEPLQLLRTDSVYLNKI